MPELIYHPKFKESMRDAVSRGVKCPTCLGIEVKHVGSNPDGMNMNHAYDCKCGTQWEGY